MLSTWRDLSYLLVWKLHLKPKLWVFGEMVLICWRAWRLGIWLVSFHVWYNLIESTKIDLWNSVGGLFQRQASRQSVKALVVSVPLLPWGAKPNSLSAGCAWSPVCMIQPVFCYVFFPGISLLFLSLPLLRLGCKSTFLSPGFCVQKPRQYNMISCEFDHFSVFFFSWFIFRRMESLDVAGVL